MGSTDLDQKVSGRLERLPGFVALQRINPKAAEEMVRLEAKAERRAVLGMIPAENQGVREALKREVVYVVAYRPAFFAAFRERTHGASVVMTSGGEVVGEEVVDPRRLRELRGREDIILIGSDFVVYKKQLRRARGEVRIVLPARTFPPLQDMEGVQDVVSGSPSPPVDRHLKRQMGVDEEDPEIGTAIVGFTLVRD